MYTYVREKLINIYTSPSKSPSNRYGTIVKKITKSYGAKDKNKKRSRVRRWVTSPTRRLFSRAKSNTMSTRSTDSNGPCSTRSYLVRRTLDA